ncbi:hypothetical protein AJ78_04628 [Emergomyces pasteurianus Ep9510]|uniref:Major facilitator superfamily (MFS) profile domain-containing protein n=1 Tax=Emergomyces pasteurianus Ep9510 TaxID=1447872 RepID=A0A1J9PEZ8_9EURO|nr:hypothetical protein AJ78_04628 [Emergomyces pasteurianus Ep9510]
MKSIPEAPGADGAFNEHNSSHPHFQDGRQGVSFFPSAKTGATRSSGEKQPANVEIDEMARGEGNDGKQLLELANILLGLGLITGDSKVDIEEHPARRSNSSNPPEENSDPLGSELPEPDGLSRDLEGNIYPEGGLQAYMVVFGSFMALFGTLGLSNSLGSFLAWLSTHQLEAYSQRTISWIFDVYAFLMFFGGLQVGPIFDAKGPRYLFLAGSVMAMLSIILIGFCKEYWHFMVVWGIIGGIAACLIFTPAFASPGHFFYRCRGRATGIAATGGGLGGIVIPLMLQDLLPKVGFGWATRAVALVTLVSVTVGCILAKSRLPKKKATKDNILPDFRILWEPQFALTTLRIFFIEGGLFIPISYLPAYALSHGMSEKFSHQLLAIFNAGSCFGRWIPGFMADYLGRFNTMIVSVLICFLSCTCLWLPASNSVAMLVLYALVFGFGSGSNISLAPGCIGQCCKTEN